MASQAPSGPRRATHRGVAIGWAALYGAIALDVAQVFALDYSDGFANPLLAAAAVSSFVAELYLFSVALRHIPVAVAVGLFGLGTATVAVISIGWLGESFTTLKGVALLTVIAGTALLNTEGANPS